MVAAFITSFKGVQYQPVDRWSLCVLFFCVIIMGPIVAVIVTAVGDSGGLWDHLLKTVLGRYITNTVILMAGVGLLAIGFGVSSAWVISRYTFPGSRMFEWMLLLPAH